MNPGPVPSPSAPRKRRLRWLFALTVVLGAGLYLWLCDRPEVWQSRNLWRESDYVQVARNFHREGLNPLHPKVDWREDTGGDTQMEFPGVPLLAALVYEVTGLVSGVLRILSGLITLGALLAFVRLARLILPPRSALVACLLFALHPLVLDMAGGIQPEPLQLLMTLLAVTQLQVWQRERRWAALYLACLFTAGAILAKLPAAYLGLLTAYVLLRTLGFGALRRPQPYVAACLALVPPLLWYVWAHGLYVETGLSLGMADETHFLTARLLGSPAAAVLGNIKREAMDVLFLLGALPAGLALLRRWRGREPVLVWYLAVAVFYLLAANTTGDGWAYYYHLNSVPPACLLMGAGYRFVRVWARRRARALPARWAARVVLVLLVVASLGRAGSLWARREHRAKGAFEAMMTLAPAIPADARIVVRGGTRFDALGQPVAYRASMAFAWLDRKGFVYAEEDLSFDRLRQIAARGGEYWIAEPADLQDPEILRSVQSAFELVARAGNYRLYKLEP